MAAREEDDGGLGAGRLDEEQTRGDAGTGGHVHHALRLGPRRRDGQGQKNGRGVEEGANHVRGAACESSVNEKNRRAAVWFS